MQTNKTILGLLAALLVLVGAKFAQQYLANNQGEAAGYEKYWQGVSVNEINSLVITQGQTALTITKQADHVWNVNEYAADATKIEEWLPKLIRPDSNQMIAEGNSQHDRLGISSASAVLSMQTPKGDKTVTLGNTTVGGRYIKLADGDQVYLVAGLPENINSTQASAWVDPVIARIDQPSISQITVVKGKDQVMIKKTETGWANGEGKEVDTTPFNSLLMTLESFATQGLAEDSTDLPKTPAVIVKVEKTTSDPITFLVYEGKDNTYVSIEGKPGIYTLSPTSLKSFELKASDLKPKI